LLFLVGKQIKEILQVAAKKFFSAARPMPRSYPLRFMGGPKPIGLGLGQAKPGLICSSLVIIGTQAKDALGKEFLVALIHPPFGRYFGPSVSTCLVSNFIFKIRDG
jgi:hypothetical protein